MKVDKVWWTVGFVLSEKSKHLRSFAYVLEQYDADVQMKIIHPSWKQIDEPIYLNPIK